MNNSGSMPPEWTQWLNAAGQQGLSMLRGVTAAMGGPADAGGGAPLFVEAWQQALNEHARSDDAEAAASRFSEAVEQSLQRMRENTRAGVAAMDGALQGLRHGQDGGHWLGAAYRTARDRSGNPNSAEALHQAFQDYTEALTDYQGQFSRCVEAALSAFQTALDEGRGGQIQGLDELHRLWIESAEPAYEAVLNSEAYTDAFARLQNATVALGGALQTHARPFLNALGIPSQAELDGIQHRLSEMRRLHNRNQRLEAEVTLLRQELDGLRHEVRALQRGDSEKPPRGHGSH